jgi:hypothetical protein
VAAPPSASPNITLPDLPEEAMQRIVSAVSQAVFASFGEQVNQLFRRLRPWNQNKEKYL